MTPEEIEAAALQPKAVTSDGTSVESHSLKDLIAAAEFVATEDTRTRTGFPLRIFHTRPPGTTGLRE